jgi:hypothetical protein
MNTLKLSSKRYYGFKPGFLQKPPTRFIIYLSEGVTIIQTQVDGLRQTPRGSLLKRLSSPQFAVTEG